MLWYHQWPFQERLVSDGCFMQVANGLTYFTSKWLKALGSKLKILCGMPHEIQIYKSWMTVFCMHSFFLFKQNIIYVT